ncbi:HNH/ENDO VII family nuclease [Photorhabdus laumondii]|uniref:LHH domain-containing protein n=2 Tax=Photorhabdus TaxID=29487 RepID=A0A329VAI5_9GAMM|nr:HNH/ENDO VII family nuclease [Photorhabdus laumondii]RAW82041.1 hypothetical protein CKY01_22430 [Photorhabdus laumondii subsp. clarkei]
MVIVYNSLAHLLSAAEKEKSGTLKTYEEKKQAFCQQSPQACKQAGEVISLGTDFVPIVGDIKGFVEAESALDYLAAAVAIIPGAGDAAGKAIKVAEKALQKGDIGEASKLLNKASEEVNTARYFGQERKYWSAEPIEFQGNKVYQRNDIFEPKYIDLKSGKTNIELMSSGRAPIGTDGKPVNLHHMLQKQDGAIAEITQSFHKENHGVIHINDNSIPSGINRAEFNKWRSNYWKDRAKSYK